jgi:hypothetical protein
MKARFTVTLREIDCEVEATLCPAEPDVGIMAAYPEDWSIVEPEEAKLWELTDEEVQKIVDAASDWYYDGWEAIDEY